MSGIKESIEYKSFIPGLDDHYFTILLMILFDYAIIFFIFGLARINPSIKPKKAQNLVEWTVTYLTDFADSIIGPTAPKYYSMIVTLFCFVFVGNLMGLVPGLISPTSSLTVTAALAVIIFATEWINGLKEKGPVKFFAHFAGGPTIPLPVKFIMWPIEFLSDLSRIISLSFRLFGNIIAKEILLSVLVALVLLFYPTVTTNGMSAFLGSFMFILRPLILVLGVLVSLIQAAVISLLACIYIAGAVGSHDDHAEEHAH
ncbi:MAG TPA: F0F1 ATP synthase subunit A [Candidatus Goldiibacteriota bacterium]|nr:F0F1 ATP synthase subunit A [Candidatus Goldiibacteriota bacterium]